MTAENLDDLLLIGMIAAPFGVKGELKMKSLTDRPEQLGRRIRTIFVGKARTPRTIVKAYEHKPGLIVLSLQGVSDRDAAEELRGEEIYIKEADAAPLAEDEYFVHQLYGLRVLSDAGDEIGTVREVMTTGASDVLVVARKGQPDALIPVVRDFVAELDIPGGRVVIRPIEGLL
jgi:16S rRNA processing protein RimM